MKFTDVHAWTLMNGVRRNFERILRGPYMGVDAGVMGGLRRFPREDILQDVPLWTFKSSLLAGFELRCVTN